MSQNTEYTVDPSRLVSPDAAPADAAEEAVAAVFAEVLGVSQIGRAHV